jgi:small conductance mechanosensitive channel
MKAFQITQSSELFDPATLIGAFFYLFMAIFLAWLMGFIVRKIIKQIWIKKQIGVTVGSFLSRLIPIIIYILVAILYISFIPALHNFGLAIFASAGVVSVIIGLAAQDTLGNIIAGFSLIVYRPFEVGDSIQIETPLGRESGVIEKLRLGYTLIRTNDSRRIVVPNSIMANTVTINLTKEDGRVMAVSLFEIKCSKDIDRAKNIIIGLAKADPRVLEIVKCAVTSLDNFSIQLTLHALCKNNGEARQVREALYESVIKAFDQDKIETPSGNMILKQ